MRNNSISIFIKYSFTGKVVERHMGNNARGPLIYTVIYVPGDLVDLLKDEGRYVRSTGSFNEMPFSLALTKDGDDKRYILIAKKYLKKLSLQVGSLVKVVLEIG